MFAPRGRDVLDRICAGAPAHLRPGGDVLIVQSEVADSARTVAPLRSGGLTAGVIAEQDGPYAPIVRSRLDYLERSGLVADRGRPERVVVIRGGAGAVAA